MKKQIFKNKFDKLTYFVTLGVMMLYIVFAALFKDSDIKRIKYVPPAKNLHLYFDEELTQEVKLPFNNNKSEEAFTLYTKMPNVRDSNVIEIHGKYKMLTARLRGNIFYVSELPRFMGIKTYAGRNTCFIPLSSVCSGEVIKLTMSLQENPYGASITKVRVSTLATYIHENLAKCIPTCILAILLFVCALFSLNSFIFSYLYQSKKTLEDLDISVETFLISLSIVIWIITNYDVLGVILGNMAGVGIINYLAFTSMPVFFSAFLCAINKKHKCMLRLFQITAEANLIFQMIMFVTGTRDFTQMLFLTHVIDVIGIIMTVSAAFDFAYVKKITGEQKILSIGSAVFGVFAVVSMFLFLFGKDMNYMFLITIGFLILFGMHIVTSLLKLSTSLKEHAKLLESERNSYKDQLTNLGNRRLLYRKMAKLEALGIDNETNFIMIDVNGLKVINDTFGHDAGDELLKGTAICMTEAFPDAELICRLGGDEFFIIIREEESILERRMQRFTHYAANWNGDKIKSISVSYGIANRLKYPGMSLTELQKAADTEMYQAKSNFYKNKSELSEALDGRR